MAEVVVATIMRAEGDTGVQTHFCTFLAWLTARGEASDLVTPYAVPKWVVYPVFGLRRVIDQLSGTVSVWWYRYWHALFLQWALRRRLAQGQPCVIYAQCPLSAAAALRARQNTTQRVVLVVHFNVSQADEWAGKGMIAPDGRYASAIRSFEAVTLPRLDGLVFVSDFMRQALLKRIPEVANVKSVVVPNFVPDPEPGPGEASDLKADLLMVGTLEARKNQGYALDVIAAARRQGTSLTLTVVGDGPDRGALQARVVALGIEDLVRFAGHMPHAADAFWNHRACLHTAKMESFGIVLIEAMARSRAVFAPAVGGIPEVFQDGFDGFVIPLNDAEEAAAVITAALSANNWSTVCQKARSTFLTRFEADVAAAHLYTFLSAVVET